MIWGGIFAASYWNKKEATTDETVKTDSIQYGQNVMKQEIFEEDDEVFAVSGRDYTIVLDAGHGGNDVGTGEGTTVEKDINLQITLKMKEYFEKLGVKVVMTRQTDTYRSLEERVATANETRGDLFVSIHCNYFEDDESIKGLECYYYHNAEDARIYCENILQILDSHGEILTRNVKPEDFYVLRETNLPALLIEAGYLSNTEEAHQLRDKGYQGKLAKELVGAILETLD